MKRMILWAVVLGTVWIAPVWADTAVGYSNVFGINNTLADTRIRPPTSWSTSSYDNNAGWNLLRGQFHVHSTPDKWEIYDNSGGTQWDAVRKYKDQLGYDFLAVTDHNAMSIGVMYPIGSTDPWRGWAPHSVEITHGPLPRDAHVLAVGTNTTDFGNIDAPSTWPFVPVGVALRIDKVHSRDGLALVAHPSALPANPVYCLSVDEVRSVLRSSRPDAISIYQKASHSEALWDAVLRSTTSAVWGYAEDDYHPDWLSRGNLGISWTAVPGDPGTQWDTIKQRVKSGNYYTYWVTGGAWPTSWSVPRLRVAVDGSGTHPLIYAQLQDTNGNPYSVNRVTFIGRGGEHLKSSGGSSSSYQCKGDEVYVRVRVWQSLSGGRTLHIASQPIFVHGTGVRTLSSPNMGLLSTSPALMLRYVQPDEMPSAPPPAGYIGPVFDVTTSDGQVPPGATLDLSYEGEDLSAIGGTQYLAVYRYDSGTSAWVKVGGTVSIGDAVITTPITALGYYTISADLPQDTVSSEVFFDNPPYGGVVAEETSVKVTVNDDLGPYQVSFLMNDHVLGQDTDALDGWAVNLPYADYCTGDWTLKAVAEDLAGNRGEAEIPIFIRSDTPKPTVAFTAPLEGTVLSGSVTATGTCGDDVAVSSVILYADETLVGYGELDGSGGWSSQIDTTYLANGTRTLKAVVEDYPGNEASDSIGVTVNNGASSIGEAKKLDDGQVARINSSVVTAGTPEMGGVFYIEAGDRSSGIRVATDRTVNEGDRVSIAGILATVNGERQITASDITIISSGNELPEALGTAAAKFIPGLGSTGLLVKIWGTVTDCFGVIPLPGLKSGFILDDGSGLYDMGEAGVRIYGTTPGGCDGEFVSVTGISGVELDGTNLIPVVRTRRAGDVVEVVE